MKISPKVALKLVFHKVLQLLHPFFSRSKSPMISISYRYS
jgi:hypothetical protein